MQRRTLNEMMVSLRQVAASLGRKPSFWLSIAQWLLLGFLLYVFRYQRQWLLIQEDRLYQFVTTVFQSQVLNGRPEPQLGIWYLAAIYGHVITIVFSILGMFRARVGRKADLGVALTLGIVLLVVTVGGFPALYFGMEAAKVNLSLAALFCLFDIYGYLVAQRKDELREYSIYFFFVDFSALACSWLLLILLHEYEIPGTSPFSIGISAALLFSQAIVSATASFFIAIENVGLGELLPRKYRSFRDYPD